MVRTGLAGAGIAAALLIGACSDNTRADGRATARSAEHDVDRAVSDLKHDAAPIGRDLTHAADKAEAGVKHVVAKANAAMAKDRH